MVGDTAITDRNAAHWTNNRVRMTPGVAAALSAGECDCTAFHSVLAGWIHFRHNGEIAAELGWHEAELYPARGGCKEDCFLRAPG